MKKQTHIFFDLDHTLWDFDTNSREALKEMYDEKNLDKEIGDFEHFYKIYNTLSEEYWKFYWMGNMKREVLRVKRFKDSFEKLGFLNDEIVRFFSEEYIRRSPYKKQLVPGAWELLTFLKEEGYSLHIITNGFSEVQHIKIKSCNIGHFFNIILCSEEIGAKKPDKIVFDTAMKKAETNPLNSIMIGDSWDADIQGGKNAGMQPIWYNGGEKNAEGILQVEKLAEITQLIVS